MKNAWWLAASLAALAMGSPCVLGQEKSGPAPKALEFEIPKTRLSPPPVAVPGVQTCRIELKGDPAKKWEPLRATIPADWAGKRIKLFFEEMIGKTTVSVNGKEMATIDDVSGCAYEADVTDGCEPGKENAVALRVSRVSCKAMGNSRPGFSEPITLHALPPVNLSRLEMDVVFDARFENATMEVLLGVANEGTAGASDLEVEFELGGPGGASTDIEPKRCRVGSVQAGQIVEPVVKVLARRPAPWDPEHPNLYLLQATLVQAGKPIETARRRFGFRQVALKGNQLVVNGRPVRLHGAHLDPAAPGRKGGPMTIEAVRDVIAKFRDANVNHLRLRSTMPCSVKLCDEIGMFCAVEMPIGMIRKPLVDDPSAFPGVRKTAAWLAATYRSNPSALMWSLGNEPDVGEVFDQAAQTIRALDRRPTFISLVHHDWRKEKGREREWAILKSLDIDVDHYPSNKQITSQTANGRPWYYDEFCHVPIHPACDDHDAGVLDQWGEMLELNWEHVWATPGAIGETIFHGYGYEASYGLLDGWARPTAAWWGAKKVYCPVRIDERKPPAAPAAGQPLRIPVENRSPFSNLREYRFEWVLGDRRGTVSPDVPPLGSGTIEIPVPAVEGQMLALEVAGPRGFVLNSYRLPVGRLVPPAPPRPDFSGGLATERTADRLAIRGEGFSWAVDPKSGAIVGGKVGADREVVLGGPVLYLNQACTGWTLAKVDVAEEAGAVTATVQGRYQEAEGKYVLRFDGAGGLTVTYDFRYQGASDAGRRGRGAGFREVGLLVYIAGECRTLDWKRDGRWTTYPDDHIGRIEGTAPLMRDGSWPKAPDPKDKDAGRALVPERQPDYPWSLTESRYGTLDFASTKYNVFQAALRDARGAGILVLSDGTQHVRCKARDGRIELLVSDFSGSSYWNHLNWFHSIRKTLKPGDAIQGTARLRLVKR
jgi:beta-galactosidase